MKGCKNLSKYMQHKGMKDIQTDADAFGHDGTVSDADVPGSDKDLHDKEGKKSKKATKNLNRYEKMGKK